MKNYLFLIFVLCTSFLGAQTAYTTFNAPKETLIKSASAGNIWLGSKLTSTIGEGSAAGLADNILLSGRVVYDISAGAWKLPVISNVNIESVSDLEGFLNGDKGLGVGIYPYKVIGDGDIKTILHGGAAYKFLPSKDAVTAQQTRVFAGLEFAKKVVESSYPITLSITPLYTFNNIEENFFGLETTLVLPVSGGLGLILEHNNPFTKAVDSAFRIGLILSSPPK